MGFSRSPVYHGVELLAGFPGKVFGQKIALYQRYFDPFCKIINGEIRDGCLLGKDRVYTVYREIVRYQDATP